MNPLLFPLALILYAEGSYCVVTRKVARLVLYSYLITILTTMYIENIEFAKVSLILVHTLCYLICINLCQKWLGKVIFFLLLLGMWWVDLSIILNTLEYDVNLLGYSLLKYSHYFYREFTILAISLCSYISTLDYRHNTRENLLGLSTLLFFIIEKQF